MGAAVSAAAIPAAAWADSPSPFHARAGSRCLRRSDQARADKARPRKAAGAAAEEACRSAQAFRHQAIEGDMTRKRIVSARAETPSRRGRDAAAQDAP